MTDLLPRATADAVAPLTRSFRATARKIAVALLSAAVILAGAFYVLAPADVGVRVAVDETLTAQSYDATVSPQYTLVSARQLAKPRKPRYTEVIYGKVASRGVPVSRIVLRLTGATRATRGQGATIRIKRADRTYRAVVHLKPGRYKLTLTLRAGHKTRTVRTVRTLRSKHYYRVAATVRARGIVTFLPVTSY